MIYCPNCGAAAAPSDRICANCGSPLPPSAPTGARGNRGLVAAIVCVSLLCILTAGLWILWPHLHSTASPAPSGEAAPSGSSSAPLSTAASSPILLGSRWHGHLTISNYQGSDDLEGFSLEVWASLDASSDGRSFFEVYDTDGVDEETWVLVSFYIDLYPDHFVPVIGYEDAWILDQYLDSRHERQLTVYPEEDGSLEIAFPYQTDTESFDLYILLYPD